MTDRDWTTPVPDLEWSCWQTAVHIADDLIFYSSQVIDRPEQGYVPFELIMEAHATPSDVVRAIAVCGTILAYTVAQVDPSARAHHNYGPSDPSGFAAMGVIETLVHTYDITRGFAVDWEPPEDLCRAALDRLFPDAPAGAPGPALLWCTGRIALGDRPRRTDWRWDGSIRP